VLTTISIFWIWKDSCHQLHNQQERTQFSNYLIDFIYSDWHIFVKTISEPQGAKRTHFSMVQEAQPKDVERAFGVLQARKRILALPCKLWSVGAMDHDVIIACIILHNIIIEDDEWDRLGKTQMNIYLIKFRMAFWLKM
jgi:hypothetical protein